MALLKKVKGSTLFETMVATVLLVIIFTVASLVMQSLLEGEHRQNTRRVQERLQVLEYAISQGQLALPYAEEWEGWSIDIIPSEGSGVAWVRFQAQHPEKNEVKYTVPGYE